MGGASVQPENAGEASAQQENETEPPAQAAGAEGPPLKRLRSDDMLRLVVVLPDGQRNQLDITSESTLKVGDVHCNSNVTFFPMIHVHSVC